VGKKVLIVRVKREDRDASEPEGVRNLVRRQKRAGEMTLGKMQRRGGPSERGIKGDFVKDQTWPPLCEEKEEREKGGYFAVSAEKQSRKTGRRVRRGERDSP